MLLGTCIIVQLFGVFSTLPYGIQYDSIYNWIGAPTVQRAYNTYANYNESSGTVSGPDLTGSAFASDKNKIDVNKNIYDLAGNVREWTMKRSSNEYRAHFSGDYAFAHAAWHYDRGHSLPNVSGSIFGFRIALYVK